MSLEVKKKEGETGSSLLFRFSKRIRQSGVLTEVRKRQFRRRASNRRQRRVSAVYREGERVKRARLKKLGLLTATFPKKRF